MTQKRDVDLPGVRNKTSPSGEARVPGLENHKKLMPLLQDNPKIVSEAILIIIRDGTH